MTVRLHAFPFANNQVVPIASADFVKMCRVDPEGLARISSRKKAKPMESIRLSPLASNETRAVWRPGFRADRV